MRLAYIVVMLTYDGLIERVLDQVRTPDVVAYAQLMDIYAQAAVALDRARAEYAGRDVALISTQRLG